MLRISCPKLEMHCEARRKTYRIILSAALDVGQPQGNASEIRGVVGTHRGQKRRRREVMHTYRRLHAYDFRHRMRSSESLLPT